MNGYNPIPPARPEREFSKRLYLPVGVPALVSMWNTCLCFYTASNSSPSDLGKARQKVHHGGRSDTYMGKWALALEVPHAAGQKSNPARGEKRPVGRVLPVRRSPSAKQKAIPPPGRGPRKLSVFDVFFFRACC